MKNGRVKMFDTDAFVRKVNIKMNVLRMQDWSNGLKKGTSHWRTFSNTRVCVCACVRTCVCVRVCVYIYIYI